MNIDLTCIITGHREDRLSVASLRSFELAIAQARESGIACQPIYVLDRPNEVTQDLFERFSQTLEGQLEIVDFGDQGQSRNAALELATGKYTAFLDADDLWTRDWLVKALRFLDGQPETWIAHPAYNYFFENQASVFCHVDQEDPEFRLDLLRVSNYWDALCVCPTSIYRELPFYHRDLQNGWAYEDWYWNCETVARGKVHKVVPDTVLFKRRQKTSQTIRASQNLSMIKRNSLSKYRSNLYENEATN